MHHPFRIYNEEKMQEMVESVKQNGVLMPILVRPLEDGGFEIVSGHNRVEAAKRAELVDIPANIREMDDETAIIVMVDSNLHQREKLLPSEKAFAYKMKLDAIKRQGSRKDLTCVQVEHKSDDKKSRETIAEQAGESGVQITRYIRLTCLVPPLLEMVDENHLAFNPAVAISFLEDEQQFWLRELVDKTQSTPSLAQAERIKMLSQRETLDFYAMEAIMNETKPQQNQLSIKGDKILKYFPGDYTPQQIEEVILKLLDQWHQQQETEGR
jgi:ParB family transcriptional regulator, chromosome partitioning protein